MGYPAKKNRRDREAAMSIRNEDALFAHIEAEDARHIPGTSAVYRMVGTGSTGHTGAAVKMLFATGAIAMGDKPRGRANSKSRDAAGDVKSQVGLTVRSLDYVHHRPHRFEATSVSPKVAAHRAGQIAAYKAK